MTAEATTDDGSSSSAPDYSAVPLPTKPPTEYSYVERRAELLEQVVDAGHPMMLRQHELAERYGVNQSTISRDLDWLERVADGQRDVGGIQ